MPTETALFLAFIVLAFGAFAVTLWRVDAATAKLRRKNHPIPGE